MLTGPPQRQLIDHFPELVAFIKDGLEAKGGKVLVHCAAGMSRSVTTIISYLVAEKEMRWKQALALIKSARPVVRPNPAFKKQLAQWERQCRGGGGDDSGGGGGGGGGGHGEAAARN